MLLCKYFSYVKFSQHEEIHNDVLKRIPFFFLLDQCLIKQHELKPDIVFST